MADHRCDFLEQKRGPKKCECGETFPCRDRACGHFDCHEERGALPLCHFCRRRVEGPVAGYSLSSPKLPELAGSADGKWSIRRVHAKTRAAHLECSADRSGA